MLSRYLLAFVLGVSLLAAQLPPRPTEEEKDPKLPNGKSQREEILKAEHEKTLKDAADLLKATEDLKAELEKNDSHVLSVASLKQLDTIDKLSKRIRGRLKRY
jgi:hypothetical protein